MSDVDPGTNIQKLLANLTPQFSAANLKVDAK